MAGVKKVKSGFVVDRDPARDPESDSDLALRCAALTSAFAAARGEIDRLRGERDDARRLVCDDWHDPAAGAKHHGWVGLYPEPANSPKGPDGWGRCNDDDCRHHADSDSPCRRWDWASKRCGDCPHFEPEDKP